jgi:hypothetical protein
MAIASVALAAGTDENTESVLGKVSPKKLDKKKYKPVKLYAGVETTTTHAVPGQQNPEQQLIEFGKNLKFKSSAAPRCTAPLAGTTTDQARQACPGKSVLGTGVAHANLGGGPDQVSDVTVTTFNGPANNEITLHAFSPSLGAANTQVVLGKLIKAPSGGKYGKALLVSDAPDLGGDAFMLTRFDTTIERKTGVVLGRCKDKKFRFHNVVTYDDGTTDTADLTQKCKRKKSRGNRGHHRN